VSTVDLEKPSAYLEYLPGIYQQDAETRAFISRYLKIFEKFLTGIDDDVRGADGKQVEGIELKVARLHEFFNPETTEKEFLDWLAGWTALVLREDWDQTTKRRLIRRIIPLYRIRGTKKGLEEYLKIYVGSGVEIKEYLSPLRIGVTSMIGENTMIGGAPPHFFAVYIGLSERSRLVLVQKSQAVKAIIDMEKPAHTYYRLTVKVPSLQIGHYSTIGENTLLGGLISD
jgi:phage tail-like protein